MLRCQFSLYCACTVINKAFVGLGSCHNVQTETSIFEFGTLFQIFMFFLVTPPLKGIDIPMRGLSRIYISCKKRCHAKFLSSAYVVSPGPTSHKKLSCGLFVTFQWHRRIMLRLICHISMAKKNYAAA